MNNDLDLKLSSTSDYTTPMLTIGKEFTSFEKKCQEIDTDSQKTDMFITKNSQINICTTSEDFRLRELPSPPSGICFRSLRIWIFSSLVQMYQFSLEVEIFHKYKFLVIS